MSKPVESLDPIVSVDATSGTVLSLLHRKLYRAHPDGSIAPDLLRRVRFSRGRAAVTLKSARFHTGESIIPADVAFSLSRLKKSGRQAWILDGVKEIAAFSNGVVFDLEANSLAATRVLWSQLAARLTMPQCSVYQEKAFPKILTAGDYSLTHRDDESLSLQAQAGGQNMLLRVLRDETSQWFFFQRGLLDVYAPTGIYRLLPFDENRFKKQEAPQLVVLYAAIVAPLRQKSVLHQRAFRQAINHRFPREMVAEKVLLGAIDPADHPVPPSLAAAPAEKYSYQPQFPHPPGNDEVIDVISPSDRERQTAARVVVDTLQKMGMKPRLRVLDLATALRFNKKRIPGIYVLKWIGDFPHASNFLVPLFHSSNAGAGNRAHFSDREVDRMLGAVGDDEKLISRLQNKIRIEAPWIFIGFSQENFLVRRGLDFTAPVTYTAWGRSMFEPKKGVQGDSQGE